MFTSVDIALRYIEQTIENHLTGNEQVVLSYTAPRAYFATLLDPETQIVHAATTSCPDLDSAIKELACVIRDESDIGAH